MSWFLREQTSCQGVLWSRQFLIWALLPTGSNFTALEINFTVSQNWKWRQLGRLFPTVRLSGLLPKPTGRQQGRGRQSWCRGRLAKTDPARILPGSGSVLPPPRSMPLATRPVSGWGTGSRRRCWSGCKPWAEGARPSSQPMGGSWPPQTPLGRLPAATLLSASCSPALRPTTCHDTSSYKGALLPPPAWMRLPTGAEPWGGIAWDLPAHKGQGQASLQGQR